MDSIHSVDASHGLGPDALSTSRKELLHGNGIVRLRGLVPPLACENLRSAALRKADSLSFDGWPGVWSKRVKDPLEWSAESTAQIVNTFADRAGPLLDIVLGPRAWITSIQALALFPVSYEELSEYAESQLVGDSLHSDYPYGEFKEGMDRACGTADAEIGGWQFPADFPQPRTLQFTVVLDSFTAERGATRMLPKSSSISEHEFANNGNSPESRDLVALCGAGVHIPSPHRARDRQRFADGCVAIEAAQGDAIVYIGHTWHTISVNRGNSPRVALLMQASPFYFAPLEAAAWMTHLAAERHLTRRSKELIGLPGTTIEGIGGDGEESSRVPHRCEPRPIPSCASFALDTFFRTRPFVRFAALALIAGSSLLSAVLAARAPPAYRVPAHAGIVSMALICGYGVGILAIVRRFDF